MKIVKNILTLLLCLSLAFSAATLVSCNQQADGASDATETATSVSISPAGAEKAAVDLSAVVAEIEADIKNDLRDELIAEIEHELASGGQIKDLVVITDYVQPNTGKDVSDEIQKVIRKNSNKTIYFPDGEYVVSKAIETSGNPTHSVSLHLSEGAVIKASDDWGNGGAVVSLGGLENYNSIYINGSNYYFYGGTVDGNGKADGIDISSGRETAIRGVDIINTRIGIHIKKGANGGSSDADMRDITIKGNGRVGSIGVKVVGSDNTFTNIDIENVQTGFEIGGGGNFLRQVRAKMTFVGDEVPFGYEYSVGFSVVGGTTWFDTCSSEQFATGFSFASQTIIFRACSASWYSAAGNKEVAFACTGSYKASIVNARVDFRADATNRSFLNASGGGDGVITSPMFDQTLCDNDGYKAFLDGAVLNNN